MQILQLLLDGLDFVNLLLILGLTVIGLQSVTITLLISLMFANSKIRKGVRKIIMNQQEFDAKITAANEALDAIAVSQTEIAQAIADEAAQITEFIRGNPSVNTSALEGVVTRLTAANESLSTVNESIGGIFEPDGE